MGKSDTAISLIAGGTAGTMGAVATCPLEVIKTRLQSSNPGFTRTPAISSNGFSTVSTRLPVLIRDVVRREGISALFKGLWPNVLGVAPTRAIYFTTYVQAKELFNGIFQKNTAPVFICSAAAAGSVTSTLTSPLWLVKTRLQLNHGKNRQSMRQIFGAVYYEKGLQGFFRGVSASYLGISETIIHFVIYEAVKKQLREWNMRPQAHLLAQEISSKNQEEQLGCAQLFLAGSFSKGIATCVAYPHEILRTRLREEGQTYKSLGQTALLVFKHDGVAGFYRGLSVQLIRQIPNMGIMMATFELTSCYLRKYSADLD